MHSPWLERKGEGMHSTRLAVGEDRCTHRASFFLFVSRVVVGPLKPTEGSRPVVPPARKSAAKGYAAFRVVFFTALWPACTRSSAPTHALPSPSHYADVVLCRIRLSDSLQQCLVEDCMAITQQKQLVPLPRTPSVDVILQRFQQSLDPSEYVRQRT